MKTIAIDALIDLTLSSISESANAFKAILFKELNVFPT